MKTNKITRRSFLLGLGAAAEPAAEPEAEAAVELDEPPQAVRAAAAAAIPETARKRRREIFFIVIHSSIMICNLQAGRLSPPPFAAALSTAVRRRIAAHSAMTNVQRMILPRNWRTRSFLGLVKKCSGEPSSMI